MTGISKENSLFQWLRGFLILKELFVVPPNSKWSAQRIFIKNIAKKAAK